MTRSPPPIPKMKPQPSFFDPQPPKASEDQSKGAVKSSKPGPPKIDRNEPLDYIVMADHKLGALWTHKRRPRTAPALQAVTDAGKETTTTSEETGKERQITLAPGTPTIEEVTMYEESLLRDSEAKASTPRLQKKEPKELFYPVGTGRPVESMSSIPIPSITQPQLPNPSKPNPLSSSPIIPSVLTHLPRPHHPRPRPRFHPRPIRHLAHPNPPHLHH